MPYLFYTDSETGQIVEAICCGHGGILMDSKEMFEEGDYIVKFQVDLEGNRPTKLFTPETFKKRFHGDAEKIDWKAMGWPV